jgi:hypothetical protein
VADLKPMRVAALVHARAGYGRGRLPEPVGLTVDRHSHLTLVFDSREAMEAWRHELRDPRPVPTRDPSQQEAWQGGLADENGGRQLLITTTVVYRSGRNEA